MKILIILYIGFDTHGPSVHLLKDIIKSIAERGHNIELILRNRTGSKDNIPEEFSSYNNINYHIINDKKLKKNKLIYRYFSDIHYATKCRKIFKKINGIDAVFLQSNTSPFYPIKYIKKDLCCPVIFNVQNIFPIDAIELGYLSRKSYIAKYFRKLQSKAYQKADKIITISDDMKKCLIEEKCDSSKIDVIHNWTYSDSFYDIDENDNLFLNDHPEFKNKFRVVFSGNLGKMVNYNMILYAAKSLSYISKIVFIIIGDGNNYNLLKQKSIDEGLDNIVFFPYQPVEYAPSNYSMANININPLPKGIIRTCLPSKTAIMLNIGKPMVISVEKDSSFSRMLEQIPNCKVVDVDDYNGFVDQIKNIYEGRLEDINPSYSRKVFMKYFSKQNAKLYADCIESVKK